MLVKKVLLALLFCGGAYGVKAALDEDVWPRVETGFLSDDPATYRVIGPYFKGKLIHHPNDVSAKHPTPKDKGTYFFRRTFTLAKQPVKAWLQGSGDDSVEFFINGVTTLGVWDWRKPRTCSVTKQLRIGENILSVRHENAKWDGGFVCELFIRYVDGSFDRISSDASFACTDKPIEGWLTSSCDVSDWVVPVERALPPAPPWMTKLPYRDYEHPQEFLGGGPSTPYAKGGEMVTFEFDFKGPIPTGEVMVDVILRRSGKICFSEPQPLQKDHYIRLDNKRWRLRFPFVVPSCLSGDFDYALESDAIVGLSPTVPVGRFSIKRIDSLPGFENPIESHVEQINGSPEFVVNGNPFYAHWGTVYYGARPDKKPRVGPMPLNLVTIWTTGKKWYPSIGVIDGDYLDCEAEKHCRANPGAYWIWDLTVYPPPDWKMAHEDHLVLDDRGGRREHDETPFSFASKDAVRVMADGVCRAIRHLEASPYANRIIGYRISSGYSPEWLGFSPVPGRIYDYSSQSREGFRRWAAQHYPELGNAEVPSLREREELDNGDWLLWDQRKHLPTVAFHEYYSELVADALIEVNRRARCVLGEKKVVGTYHGYTMFLNANGRDQMRALFNLKKVLDSGTVDFMVSPQAYGQRRLGGTCEDMKPFRSLQYHNIVSAIENDMRTHGSKRNSGYDQTVNTEQTLSIMRRDMSIELCRRNPSYYYAIVSGLEYDFPEMKREGAVLRAIGEHGLATGAPRRNAEVALVVSEKTILSLPLCTRHVRSGDMIQTYQMDGSVRTTQDVPRGILTGEPFVNCYTRYARAGAPVDYLLAEDIADNPGDYKLYIFTFAFKYDAHMLRAVEKIRERGAAVLWLYAPGYSYGLDSSVANMERLTGMKFELLTERMLAGVTMKSDGRFMGLPKETVSPLFSPVDPDEILGIYENGRTGIGIKRSGNSQTVFSGAWKLDVPFIMDIYRRVGVHIYSETTDPIEANEKLFTLHARFAGEKTIRLPQKTNVLDCYAGRIIARNADVFKFYAPLHSTHLFYCADDADVVEKQIQESLGE